MLTQSFWVLMHWRRIGVPLVWRYTKVKKDGKERVLVQFKASLKNRETFEKSEWGP